MGGVFLAWDMFGYGDARQSGHKLPEAFRLESSNSSRALDFLLSLSDVDSTRIAVTGESGGGTQSFMLVALDPRVRVSVPVVLVSAHFVGGGVCESGMAVPKGAGYQPANSEIAAQTATTLQPAGGGRGPLRERWPEPRTCGRNGRDGRRGQGRTTPSTGRRACP